MRPKRSTAARTAASASARLVTSSLTASKSLDSPKALDTRSVSRPEATTAWPAAKAAVANWTPIPRLAPVMNHTFLLLISFPLLCDLLFESFESVRDLRAAIALVGELSHQQCERLQIARDAQRPSVHGIE